MKLYFKQRFFSWFDSYDIYYEDGSVAYTVEGRRLSMPIFVCSRAVMKPERTPAPMAARMAR